MSIRIAVLVSGQGSNLEAILQAIKSGELEAQVDVVISNNPEALALHIARKYGVHAVAIDHKGLTRQEHELLILEQLSCYPIDYVVLAGYMRILSPEFLEHYKDPLGYYRVINIHPSLLPDFPGTRAYEDVFSSGANVSGVTVHLVDTLVDHGPILAQATFPRMKEDTLETFKSRGLSTEHKLYPAVLQRIAREGLTFLRQSQCPDMTALCHAKTSKPIEPLCIAVLPRAGVSRNSNPFEFPLYWLVSDESPDNVLKDNLFIETLSEVLSDPLLEELWCAGPSQRITWIHAWKDAGFRWWAERQFGPGVTDNLGRTVEEALTLAGLPSTLRVASGTGLLFLGQANTEYSSSDSIEQYSRYRHYHPLTDKFVVHDLQNLSLDNHQLLLFPEVHLPKQNPVRAIELNLPDGQMELLSRQRVLALNLTEMKAIRQYFERPTVKQTREAKGLPQWPTDVELEIIAQTWSEHCKHKIFNATIHHSDLTKGEGFQRTTIDSLYKTYIQSATKRLSHERQDLLSVFEDNAGVLRWNDDWGMCFKVETHNSPSALEPYGGALTGILGVNRDILGTGLGAKPICNTDIFCFAYPADDLPSRPTMLPPEAIIRGVRRGVQDGGNKSGIPTVNGAVFFHPGYRAKPLVFCGTAGLLPLEVDGRAGFKKHTQVGDLAVMVGGRVGADGIHGATFSSEALHEGSPVSAVQIGDPFTQKRMTDFLFEARDQGLITGITDNGAGGLSSSVGEMAQLTGGATFELERIPLKYPGLADYEIVISESQERMTLSTRRFDELRMLAEKHHVEVTAIGTFHSGGCFEVTRSGRLVAMLDLSFLHQGVPKMELESEWLPPRIEDNVGPLPEDLEKILLGLLSHQNISSREEIIRQYDHEVQGASIIKPLMGPLQQAPCDAAVIRPLYADSQGLVISNGLCPQLSEYDTYLMAVCAVDEAVRNAVCVGADPSTVALLDNFCWPDPVASRANKDGRRKLAQLVRACEGLFDAVIAYGAPLISGKDSMKNDFDDGVIRLSIPPTLLVSAIGKVPNVENVVSMEFKSPGDLIYVLSAGEIGLMGSQYAQLQGWSSPFASSLNLQGAIRLYKQLHQAMLNGWVESCHDLSEGGLGVALSECIIGSGLGADMDSSKVLKACLSSTNSKSLQEQKTDLSDRLDIALFGEGPGRLLVTVSPLRQKEWNLFFEDFSCTRVGTVVGKNALRVLDDKLSPAVAIDGSALVCAWKSPLPFDEVPVAS